MLLIQYPKTLTDSFWTNVYGIVIITSSFLRFYSKFGHLLIPSKYFNTMIKNLYTIAWFQGQWLGQQKF